MRAKDIVIGEIYRLKNSPHYGYIKPLKILKPMEFPNTLQCILVECEHSVDLDFKCGIVRYFKPVDIIKCK